VIPLWKRPEVTELCFDGILQLMVDSKHDYSVVCAISEESYKSVCESYGFKWVWTENNPLGEKINTAIKTALSLEWDYLMMMNSDDVVKAELIDFYYQPFFDNLNPYFGVNKVTYVNFYTHEAVEYIYNFSVLGIAKCISRGTVKKMGGNLYEPKQNRCLDDTMLDRMMRAGAPPTIVQYDGMLAMDFKSDVNIWPWDKFKDKGKKVCYKRKSEPESLTEG
jgi:hypothetical protein